MERLEDRVVLSAESEGFVRQVYRDLLSREADPDGLMHWSDELDAGMTRSSLALAIVGSREYENQLVVSSYRQLLNRSPEAAGLSFWQTYVHARTSLRLPGGGPTRGGHALQEMEAEIAGSAEAFARSGGTGASFVNQLYRSILQRDADADGLSMWTSRLSNGGFASQVAAAIINSDEAIEKRVEGFYSKYLGRDSDAAGLEWIASLKRGVNVQTIVAGFVASDEYFQNAIQRRTPPTISDIGDQTSDGPIIGPIAFTVGDVQTPADNLTVTAASSNPDLVNLFLGGSGANRNITLAPLEEQSGSATITVTVADANGAKATDAFVFTVTSSPTGTISSESYLRWNDLLLSAVKSTSAAPPVAARAMAILNIALNDTTAAFDAVPGFLITQAPGAGASRAAAVAAAAHRVLATLFSSEQARFDAELNAALSQSADGPAETDGMTFGRGLADAVLAQRASDGATATITFIPSGAFGVWEPTPPANLAAQLPQWASVTPFVLTSRSQFRAPAPPAITSAAWRTDLDEVRSLGATGSTARTADQTQIAQFWADGAGTITPPGHWLQIANAAVRERGLDAATTNRVLIALSLALADSAIAAWDTKFTYTTWRPITAIRNADTIGDPSLLPDVTWTPFLVTPNHPEYVSGHSTFSRAAATILENHFGTAYSFATSGTAAAATVTRHFPNFDAAAIEAGRSRIFGGIHFQFANVAGQDLGRSVAEAVLQKLGIRNGGGGGAGASTPGVTI